MSASAKGRKPATFTLQDPDVLFKAGTKPGAHAPADEADLRFLRFRPPLLETTPEGVPALPHIRFDRALQFLIGDRLQ